VKNYNDDLGQPPDIGRSELRVTPETRLWKGEQPVKLSDLTAGDVLLVNLTGEFSGAPSRCTDIGIGAETHQIVTAQRNKKAEKK